jgi:hypothetical protein
MQNVCRRPSDRLLGILARLFLEPKFPHTNFSISSHLPDEVTTVGNTVCLQVRERVLSLLQKSPRCKIRSGTTGQN